MARYVAMVPPDGRRDRAELVRDGFSLFGLVLPLIWLLANLAGFGRLSEDKIKPITLGAAPGSKPPGWLASSLRRLT